MESRLNMTAVYTLSKYLYTHPLISPEGFPSHLYSQDIIRALYIPSDRYVTPYVITDKPDDIISMIFSSQEYGTLYPDLYYHVCYSYLDQFKVTSPNYIATTLIRNAYAIATGKTVVDAIYGDVLIFGSFNYKEELFDESHHSVPYEVVEQIFRIHELKKYL